MITDADRDVILRQLDALAAGISPGFCAEFDAARARLRAAAAEEDGRPTLASQLLTHRTAAALSQRALATRAGVRQATVATIEGGANTDAATLAKLADALGVALTVHPGATPPERRAKR